MECYRKRFRKCVVPGCGDVTQKKHRFPKNDIAIFEKWISQVRSPFLTNKTKEQIYKNDLVCDLHFAQCDKVPGTHRGLKKNAIPTKFLPMLPKERIPHCLKDFSGIVNVQVLSNGKGDTLSYTESSLTEGPIQLKSLQSDTSYAASSSTKDPSQLKSLLLQSHPSGIENIVKQSETPSYAASSSTEGPSQLKSLLLQSHPSGVDNIIKQTKLSSSPSTSSSSKDFDQRNINDYVVESFTNTETYSPSTPKRSRRDRQSHSRKEGSEECHSKLKIRLSIPKRKYKSRKSILKSVNATRQNQLTAKEQIFYRNVIQWGNKISVLGNRINSYKKRLRAAQKAADIITMDTVFQHVNAPTYNFILSQINTQKKTPKARRFSVDDKILALSLIKASGRGYRFLSKIFSLPSRKTLTNFLNRIPFTPGINNILFDNLKQCTEKMNQQQKCCVLMFDEMSLSCHIQYNRKDDYIEGIDDSALFPGIIDHANVFMVQGVFSRWKQPLCFTFSDGPVKTIPLKTMIKAVIEKCQSIGLNVVATVCDQGGANQAAINSLLKDTEEFFKRNQEENKLFGFMINNVEVIPLYDVPHLFKGLRNNLMEKDLHFYFKGRDMVAKWSHIESFYKLDSKEEDRMCSKLTDRHVLKANINKMKVSTCMQVFSHQVGSIMKVVAKFGAEDKTELEAEAINTAELILFLDKLFDSLNNNSKVAPSTKPMKGGVTERSKHEDFWREAIRVIKSMKFYNFKKQCLVTVPSLRNLVYTLRGFIHLKTTLLSKFKFKFILTRFFNQDPLENFFSYIRSHNGRNVSPGVTQFIASFKSLMVNNFLSRHSPYSNCEKDESGNLLLNLKKFLLSNVPDVDDKIQQFSNLDLNLPVVTLSKPSKIARCTMVYYTGFIVKQIFKKVKCNSCKNNLVTWSNSSDTDFIEAREYCHNLLLRPGGFITFLVSQAVPLLYNIIPHLAHKQKISLLLKHILLKKINFTPINCPEHNLGEKILSYLIRCAIYFWCRKLNKIVRGQDSKFVYFLKNCDNKSTVDPVKIRAHKKWENKRKLKKSN